MYFKVEIVKNGLVYKDGETSQVFEEVEEFEDFGSDYKAWVNLFFFLISHYSINNSRHDEKRIYINTYPGDKCADSKYPSNCPLCGEKTVRDRVE